MSLSGVGSGTRMWPLSRKNEPKQFLSLTSDKSMFQETLLRLDDTKISNLLDPVIVCNKEYRDIVFNQLKEINAEHNGIILEPIGRNTAPAATIAANHAVNIFGNKITIFILPADHYIEDKIGFLENIIIGSNVLVKNDVMITFGIQPHSAHTGYGYIKSGKKLDNFNAFNIEEFKEKPDKVTAEKYLREGGYYWNSGMFIWKVSVLLNEIKRYLPNLHTQLDKLSKNTIEVKGPYPFKELNNSGKKIFKSLQPVSIDHGIMEKSSNSVVFPTNIGWNDVGSWTALADISQKDPNGNVIKGNVLSIENNNSIIYAEERLVATMGLENMIVVDTSDAVLICPKDCAQDVKKIVEQIKLEKRPEVSIAPNSEIRPWGNYVILQKEANYLVKRIEVLPGESLSLQSHNHRSEHWTIVSGTAQVEINELSKTLQANQFIEIPKGAKHRLANHSKFPLIIIEVQLGENLDENDITRYEDKYGRTSEGKGN